MSSIHAHGQEKKLEKNFESNTMLVILNYYYFVTTTKYNMYLFAIKDRVLREIMSSLIEESRE